MADVAIALYTKRIALAQAIACLGGSASGCVSAGQFRARLLRLSTIHRHRVQISGTHSISASPDPTAAGAQSRQQRTANAMRNHRHQRVPVDLGTIPSKSSDSLGFGKDVLIQQRPGSARSRNAAYDSFDLRSQPLFTLSLRLRIDLPRTGTQIS